MVQLASAYCGIKTRVRIILRKDRSNKKLGDKNVRKLKGDMTSKAKECILQPLLKKTHRKQCMLPSKTTLVAELELQFRQMAAANNMEQCAKLLNKPHVSVNSAGANSGRTSLHWAAHNGHVKMVDFLLKNGAQLTKDVHGYTAYDLAESQPRISRMLQYHFKEYFRLNAPNPIQTPTFDEMLNYGYVLTYESQEKCMASIQQKSLIPFHKMLIKNKLSVNSYINGVPIIMLPVVMFGLSHSYKNKGFLDYFIEHECNLNLKAHRFQRDAYQGTVLHSLLANENVDLAMHILNKAKEESILIDPTIQDVEGKTIILMGALLRAPKFLTACLQHFGNDAINIADEQGMSPLHYACLFSDEKTIDVLMHYGADPQLISNENKRPLEMLMLNNDEARELIIEQLAKFHINAETRMTASGKSLLDKCLSDRQAIRARYETYSQQQSIHTI